MMDDALGKLAISSPDL
jgi:hypothetical protein